MERAGSAADDREQLIAELEKGLAKAPKSGLLAPVALIAIVGAGVLLWLQRADLAYLFASREPIELGREGDYRFERLESNVLVRVHGAPTARAEFSLDQDGTTVIVGLRDTPLLVRRRAVPGEEWGGGGKPPPPSQVPFTVVGRLLSRRDAARYELAFSRFEQLARNNPELSQLANGPLWLVDGGARPGEDSGTWTWSGLLVLFALLNGYLLFRGLSVRARRAP